MMSPTNRSGIALKKFKEERKGSVDFLSLLWQKPRGKIQGKLLQLLEDDLNCVICSCVLIEVSSAFHSDLLKFVAAFSVTL